jgi:tetraacyldisaccharide 4'-kinase
MRGGIAAARRSAPGEGAVAEMSSEAISKSAMKRHDAMKSPPSPFVVSVGNIAFGGRGKSPTVACIARLLLEMGERPAILSRGYGRKIVDDGVVVVSDGRRLLADLDRAGDEPLMLARDLPGVPVLVCEQRAIAGTLATEVLGATALVLDDGFQHRQMARDVDLVLVTAEDLEGRRVPLGRLRESPPALARADAVIRVDGPAGPSQYALSFTNDEPVPLTPESARLPTGSTVFALAGIAGPDRFTRAARDAGFIVAGEWAPGDHYRYTREDVARLAREAAASGAAAVLTTSKDAVRLLPLRPLPFAVYEWPLRVSIEPARQFAGWLVRRRDEARAGLALQAAPA